MELLILIAIVGAVMILSAITSGISNMIEEHKQEVRNRAAHEVLDHRFSFEKEKDELLAINKTLNALIDKRKRNKLWDTTKRKRVN